jgi:hypothetical protein
MKLHIRSLLALFGLVCGACVPSIHPLYTEADQAFEPGIIGTWEEKGSAETWKFSMDGENEYRLIHTDESGKKGEFEARLFKLGGHMFLDLYPAAPVVTQNDFYRGHVLPLHTFVKLIQDGPAYQVSFLEPKWMKAQLAKDPSALRHTVIDGEILITDSTANLQKFVVANVATPGAFAPPSTVHKKGGKK